MRDEAALITEFLADKSREEFKKDIAKEKAVAMCFTVLGELEHTIDDDFKKKYPDVPWAMMRRVRNLIAHSYFSIDFDRLWEIARYDVPILISLLNDIIEKENYGTIEEAISEYEDE
ncbi:MAG: DUF86 domain-containing protein [Oscillospiraceae bacterium]|jgi:uncharacterized protein with HEPN domain|nr:DUF86 domain-containing protein [Oscillospiraceae bacterium]